VVHGCLRMTRELDAARRMIAAGADFIVSQLK
jgi:acetyl esterase